MNGYMMAGMIVGIAVAIIIVKGLLRFTKKNKKEKFTYDERQKAARGEAYKYAFFTLVIYNAAYGIFDMATGIKWTENLTGMMLGVCLAVLVHVVYSIWHECYFSMNEEPKKVLIIFGVICLVNVLIAVVQGLDGELIENGMLTNNLANLVVSVMFGVIMITLAAKWISKKNEIEEEE